MVSIGRKRRAYVHVLVLEAFVGPRPADKPHTRHLDGDGANNRVENLRWGSVAENQADTIRHGRTTRGEKNTQAKLSKDDVLAIRDARSSGVRLKALAWQYGVAVSSISRAANGVRWGHIS